MTKRRLLKQHKKVRKLLLEVKTENSIDALNKLPYVRICHYIYRDAFKTLFDFILDDGTNLGVRTNFFMVDGIHEMSNKYLDWYCLNKHHKIKL